MQNLDKRQQDFVGIGLMLLSFFVIAFGFIVFLNVSKQTYNEITLCPDLPEQQRITILIDRTDPFTNTESIRQRILQSKSELEIHGRLAIFVLDESGEAPKTPVFDLCNPGRGADVSPLYRNPKRVEDRFIQKFSNPLDELLSELLKSGIAPKSRISESFANAISYDTANQTPTKHQIILISDLLENSDYMNSYRKNLSIEPQIFSGLFYEKFGRNTVPGNTSVLLDVVWRNNLYRRQKRLLEEFWTQGLQNAGFTVSYTHQ